MNRSSHLASLTGLRGVAALWVLGFHLNGVVAGLGLDLGPVQRVLDAGYLGVDLFFALSGFVIAYAYASKLAPKRPEQTWRSFMRRRFARMYPVHLFVILLLSVGIVASRWIGRDLAAGADYGAANLLRHLSLSQVWLPGGTASWNAPSWSIHAEWFAYACFPFAAAALVRAQSSLRLLALAACGYLALIAFVQFALGGDYDQTYRWGLLRCIVGFSAGACLWRAWTLGALDAPVVRIAARSWPMVVVALLLLGAPHGLVLPAVAALVVALVANQRLGGLLATRPLQYLGRISYALYMTHHLVLTQLIARLPPEANSSLLQALALLVVYVLAMGMAAHLTYTRVEEPMRKFLLEERLSLRAQLVRS